MRYQDYYQVLGVARDASMPEIKKAFRKLARKYHPDVSKEADAEVRMKEVNEAYTVLSDPEKRAAYDQLGQGYQGEQEFRPPPGWDAGFEFSGAGPSPQHAADFSDFFAELFGNMGHAQSARRRRGPAAEHGAGYETEFRAPGDDHHAKILLDLDTAFTGAVQTISLRLPGTDEQGRLKLQTRALNVKIPIGIRAGQTIRLAGQGAPGYGGGPAGDLLLEVQFKPHPSLRPDGRDLHMTLKVTPWEAALGAHIPVNLPSGPIQVRLPAGAQSGQTLRVRGKGLPGVPAGDLLLELKVVLPPADSAKAKELYTAMASALAFDPRSGV